MKEAVEQLLQDALQARREHRRNDARNMLVEALRIARDSRSAQLPFVLTRLGAIERDLGHGEAALKYYQEAAGIHREHGRSLALAHTVRHVGDILYEARRFREAEVCFNEALTIYDEHPEAPPLDLGNAIRSLAVLKDDLGESETARVLWIRTKGLYELVGVEAGVAECSARLSKYR